MKREFPLGSLLKQLDGDPRADDAAAAEARRKETVARMMALRAELRRGGGMRPFKARFWAALVAAVVFAAAAALFIAKGMERTEATRSAAAGVRLRAIAGLVEVEHGGKASLVGADPLVVAPDDRVRTHAGALASVFLPSGATFSVAEESSLQVKGRASLEEVELGVGRIDVHVPRLDDGAGFIVHTGDAAVTVHGTRFSVDVRLSPEARFVTQVEVSEGVVAVESAGKRLELRRGERWSSAAAPSVAAPPSTESPAIAAPAPAESASAEQRAVAAQRPSTLGSENELLAQALSAIAARDDARALALLDAFLARHGRSPLAENAALERLRILARQKSPAAGRVARQYLARYPQGVGRDLARRLATDGTGLTPEAP